MSLDHSKKKKINLPPNPKKVNSPLIKKKTEIQNNNNNNNKALHTSISTPSVCSKNKD